MRNREAATLILAISLVAFGGAHAQSIDLSHRRLVFNEDFTQFSVSQRGPGTRWIAHTPWGGDFGDAAFADPRPEFPFTRTGGIFRIELRKDQRGAWKSGLLASQDANGDGFGLRYGYFEIRTRLPAGPGVWPAFWLGSMPPKASPDPGLEVDIFEQYGQFPAAFNSTVTLWPKNDPAKRQSAMHINKVAPGSLSTAFHTYGADVGPAWITFYFDRHEIWRTPTPAAHTHKLMILLDLALGGGWPITATPSPSWMEIEYVKAWAAGNDHAG